VHHHGWFVPSTWPAGEVVPLPREPRPLTPGTQVAGRQILHPEKRASQLRGSSNARLARNWTACSDAGTPVRPARGSRLDSLSGKFANGAPLGLVPNAPVPGSSCFSTSDSVDPPSRPTIVRSKTWLRTLSRAHGGGPLLAQQTCMMLAALGS
jgi:hypothetical protein